MFFKKGVCIGLLGIFLFIVFVFWQQINQQRRKPPISEPNIGKADVTIKNMELSETSEGDLEWRLKAEEAQLFEKQGIAYLKKIVLAYSEEKGEEIVLTGDRGKIYLSEKNVFLEGNVNASSSQVQLKTKALSWFRGKRMLVTEDQVWLKQRNIEITGQGMAADSNLGKIKLNKEVETVVY